MKKNLLFSKIALLVSIALFSANVLKAQDVTAPDSVTPDVTMIDEANGIAEISLVAQDSVGVVGYDLYDFDTTSLESLTGATATTTISGLVDDSLNVFYATASDAASNESDYAPIGILLGDVSSRAGWANNRRVTTSKKIPGDATFEVSFSVLATGDNSDAAVAICKREVNHADDWNAHAVILRLNGTGTVDCRNGGSYTSDSTVSYTIGDQFDIRFVVSPSDTTFDVYISKNGGNEFLLADDYVFRDAANYKELKDIAFRHVNNPIVVSNIKWDDQAPVIEPSISSRSDEDFKLAISGSDKYGIDAYTVYDFDTTVVETLAGGTSASTTVTGLVADSLNVFYVAATDDANNESTLAPVGVLVGDVFSRAGWANNRRVTTSKKVSGDATFEVTASVLATGDNSDAAVAICKREVNHADDWNAHAVILRFNGTGSVDCRNGNTYTADSAVTYTISDQFDIRFVVSPSDTTYDVYISKNGGNEFLLADDYVFRDKANYTQLKDVAFRHVNNAIVVSNITWDNQVPVVEPAVTSQTDTSFNLSLTGTDDFGIDAYTVYDVDTTEIEALAGGTSASTTVTGLVADSLNVFYVVATDNVSADSDYEPVGVLVGDVSSRAGWANNRRVTTTKKVPGDDTFEVTASVLATGENSDAAVAICKRKVNHADDWNAHAVILRFNGTGTVDCRNGGSYTADSAVSYTISDQFDIRFVVSPSDTTYDVYLSKNGGDEFILADDYYFRDAANYTQLKDVAFRHVNNAIVVSNVVWDAVADTVAPSVPTGLTADNETSNSVDLSWTASTDNVAVTGYNVYVDGTLEETVTGTSTTITGLDANTEYDLTVSAIDAAGNESDESTAATVTTLPTSINTITASAVKVYPNPLNSSEALTIDLSSVNEASLTIIVNDVTGKLIQSEVVTKDIVTINELTSGMYIITIKGQNTLEQRKVVVQ